MRLKVGGKYRMRNYSVKYECVEIIGSKGEYDEKVFFGKIIWENLRGLKTRSYAYRWGNLGNWNNGKEEHFYDLIEEFYEN